MELANNVYFGDVLDSHEGRSHSSMVELDFVVTDEFLEVLKHEVPEQHPHYTLGQLSEELLEEVTAKSLGYTPWIPSGAKVRVQYPPLNDTVINSKEELREHLNLFVSQLCCFYTEEQDEDE